MKRARPSFLLLGALLLGCGLPAARAQQASMADRMKASVMRAEETRIYALTSGTIPALHEMMTPDCTYVHSNGRAQTKAEFLAALTSGALSYQVFQWTEAPAVRLYGGDVAVLSGRAHIEATTKATGETKFDVLYTAVSVVVDAEWTLASYQSTVAAK